MLSLFMKLELSEMSSSKKFACGARRGKTANICKILHAKNFAPQARNFLVG